MDYSVLRADILDARPDIDIKAVDQAYEFARDAHEGQTRYSGEPYIQHPIAATGILLRLNPDLATIQACLLHDVSEDTERTLGEIEAEFGEEVAGLVSGLEKLSLVKIKKDDDGTEKWKKLFLAMANDIRIVFVKLADRLHNMQTLDFVPEHKRERIARETLEVHAAIASRLGIYKFKSELEDLAFKYLYPVEYNALAAELDAHRDRSAECMIYATSQVEQLLMREGIRVKKVKGRMKHLWSLYQKMQRYDTEDIKDIYDIFAVRVILPDESDLYNVLGLLHNEYIPLQDRFKDYVAVPKPNGYRSLHATVVGLGGDLYEEPTEVQIRSEQMHKEAELGVASHWSYKAGKNPSVQNRKRHFALHRALKKVNALVERHPEIEGSVREWVEDYQHMHPQDRAKVEKLLGEYGISDEDLDNIKKGRSQESLSLQSDVDQQLAWLRGLAQGAEAAEPKAELDLYPDQIFVLTPQRDVIELPRGATPIDFAYAVHTEVGHKMTHAKANGRIVPLDYQLRNGEMVEVGTRKDGKPNRYWISIAKTASARSKIKNWFNKQDHDANVAAGREMVNEQLKLMGKPMLDDKLLQLKDYADKSRTLQEREQLLENVGMGVMTASQVVKTMHPGETTQEQVPKKSASDFSALSHKEITDKVLVTGEDDLPVVLSACCKPKPGSPIIGYVTRGRTIRIHRTSCKELSGLEGERFVSAHWKER
jgi:guanosine-3',5'-bis(diphosphate) 3'-pyrophosphohydrolase